jgi:hypothetical protein
MPMKLLFVSAVARTRSLRKKTSHHILPLMALLLMTIPASLQAQEKSPVPNSTLSGASAIPAPGTNEPPYQLTRYPRVQARHVPGTPPSPALLQAALQGRRTPVTPVDGPTSAGGKLLRYDDTYFVPTIAPTRVNTNAPVIHAPQPAAPAPRD